MNEYWLCERCTSMVRLSAGRCYRCGAPRPAVMHTVGIKSDPAGPVVTPGIDEALLPAARLSLIRHRYLPVDGLAVAVVAGLVAVLAAETVRFWSDLGSRTLADRSPEAAGGVLNTLSTLASALRTVEPIVALCAGTLWLTMLSVSLSNARAVGAGTPATHWFEGLLDWFLPVRNLVRPLHIVRDLYRRLAVPGSTGDKVVGAWWTACLAWFLLAYGVLFLQALEIFIAIGAAIFMFIEGAGAQPTWVWITPPQAILLAVALAATLGPTWILLGNICLIPAIGVPAWAGTLPGVYLIEDLKTVLGALELIQFVAFALSIVLLIRIVVELADRQRARVRWLSSPAGPATLVARQ